MATYTVKMEIEFDLVVTDYSEVRDHPVFDQLADIVMVQENGAMEATCIERARPW